MAAQGVAGSCLDTIAEWLAKLDLLEYVSAFKQANITELGALLSDEVRRDSRGGVSLRDVLHDDVGIVDPDHLERLCASAKGNIAALGLNNEACHSVKRPRGELPPRQLRSRWAALLPEPSAENNIQQSGENRCIPVYVYSSQTTSALALMLWDAIPYLHELAKSRGCTLQISTVSPTTPSLGWDAFDNMVRVAGECGGVASFFYSDGDVAVDSADLSRGFPQYQFDKLLSDLQRTEAGRAAAAKLREKYHLDENSVPPVYRCENHSTDGEADEIAAALDGAREATGAAHSYVRAMSSLELQMFRIASMPSHGVSSMAVVCGEKGDPDGCNGSVGRLRSLARRCHIFEEDVPINGETADEGDSNKGASQQLHNVVDVWCGLVADVILAPPPPPPRRPGAGAAGVPSAPSRPVKGGGWVSKSPNQKTKGGQRGNNSPRNNTNTTTRNNNSPKNASPKHEEKAVEAPDDLAVVGFGSEMATIAQYLGAHDDAPSTLVVTGAPGSGKTTLVRYLTSRLTGDTARASVSPPSVISVFVGSDEAATSVAAVARLVCQRLRALQSDEEFDDADAPTDPVARIACEITWRLERLDSAVIVIVDGLESVAGPAADASWVPIELPEGARWIITATQTEDAMGLSQLLRMRGIPEENFLPIQPLLPEDALIMANTWLDKSTARKLTTEQITAVVDRLCPQDCATEVFPQALRIGLNLCIGLRSTEPVPPLPLSLEDIIQKAVDRLCAKHGDILVGATLRFLAVSRRGFTAVELEDILSLDDDSLASIIPPPKVGDTVRIPSHLFKPMVDELATLLGNDHEAGEFLQLGNAWNDVVHTRFAISPMECEMLHQQLVRYFEGVWSEGKVYPATNVPHDRGIDAQPLRLSSGGINWRKLHELPYHMARSADGSKGGSGSLSFGSLASMVETLRECDDIVGDAIGDRVIQEIEMLASANIGHLCVVDAEMVTDLNEAQGHMMKVLNEGHGEPSSELYEACARVAALMRGQGRPSEARHWFQEALRCAAQVFDVNSIEIATACNDLGVALLGLGHSTAALPILHRASEVFSTAGTPDGSKHAACLINLALGLEARGQSGEAIALLRQAVEVPSLDQTAGELWANGLEFLASLEQAVGATEFAVEHWRLAVAGREALDMDGHQTALVRLRLARVLCEADQAEEGYEYAALALSSLQRVAGPWHADVAFASMVMGVTLVMLDRVEEALPLLERNLTIQTRNLGVAHPAVGRALAPLAGALRRAGRGMHADGLQFVQPAGACYTPADEIALFMPRAKGPLGTEAAVVIAAAALRHLRRREYRLLVSMEQAMGQVMQKMQETPLSLMFKARRPPGGGRLGSPPGTLRFPDMSTDSFGRDFPFTTESASRESKRQQNPVNALGDPPPRWQSDIAGMAKTTGADGMGSDGTVRLSDISQHLSNTQPSNAFYKLTSPRPSEFTPHAFTIEDAFSHIEGASRHPLASDPCMSGRRMQTQPFQKTVRDRKASATHAAQPGARFF